MLPWLCWYGKERTCHSAKVYWVKLIVSIHRNNSYWHAGAWYISLVEISLSAFLQRLVLTESITQSSHVVFQLSMEQALAVLRSLVQVGATQSWSYAFVEASSKIQFNTEADALSNEDALFLGSQVIVSSIYLSPGNRLHTTPLETDVLFAASWDQVCPWRIIKASWRKSLHPIRSFALFGHMIVAINILSTLRRRRLSYVHWKRACRDFNDTQYGAVCLSLTSRDCVIYWIYETVPWLELASLDEDRVESSWKLFLLIILQNSKFFRFQIFWNLSSLNFEGTVFKQEAATKAAEVASEICGGGLDGPAATAAYQAAQMGTSALAMAKDMNEIGGFQAEIETLDKMVIHPLKVHSLLSLKPVRYQGSALCRHCQLAIVFLVILNLHFWSEMWNFMLEIMILPDNLNSE